MKQGASKLLLILKGALIGAGAILPGVSGGVLCVTFGIYRPMIALLADPFKQFKESWRFFLPILIGFVVGVLGLSRVVDLLFRASPTPAIWLFVGLIVGSMPSLFKEAGTQGRGRGAWLSLALGFVIALIGFLYLRELGVSGVTPSFFWWLLCGALWGVGLIVPGLSPSSIFIFLGLYQPMSAGIASLTPSVILPLGLGLVAATLLLARAMRFVLSRAYAFAMHAVVGVTAASTLVIVPVGSAASWGDALLYGICFLAGFGVALWMGRAKRAEEAS